MVQGQPVREKVDIFCWAIKDINEHPKAQGTDRDYEYLLSPDHEDYSSYLGNHNIF